MPKIKTILVTGSSRGIGSAIAKELAGPSSRILINYIENKEAALETLAAVQALGSQATIFQADVADPQAVKDMFAFCQKELGPVDILVNNAGISVYGMIQDISYEEWKRVHAVNVDGAFLCSQQAIPHMVSQSWGRIIMITSMWGLVGASCESLYASTKGALHAFTKSLAKELAYCEDIMVNALAPGVVDTDMMDQLSPAIRESLVDEIPLGRFFQPEEIAKWVGHLSSPECTGLTGQIIAMSGGLAFH